MNYASVCSGAEAFGPAWHEIGYEPVFHAEIESHASAVLRYHYPNVPNYGDFTTIATENGANPTRPVRLLCGGTPCQTFSVAGLREGLDSHKGNLTLEFVRLAKRLGAQWLLWENVPGVLSADNGEAFGSFLGALAECGYGFAYRVLDLQHWGVPQRRKRVFVVAYLGDWRPAAAVLFERESLLRHSKKGGKTGQDITGTLSSRATAGGGLGTDFDCAGGLVATCYDENQITSRTNRSNPQPGSVCHTLPASPTAPLLASGISAYGGGNTTGEINTAACLTTGNQRLDFDTETFLVKGAAIGRLPHNGPQYGEVLSDGTCYTLNCVETHAVSSQSGVRRLTPLECERLMGWADEHTKYGVNEKGKTYELADGPRYRICGNGWGQPVVTWIAKRIKLIDEMLHD